MEEQASSHTTYLPSHQGGKNSGSEIEHFLLELITYEHRLIMRSTLYFTQINLLTAKSHPIEYIILSPAQTSIAEQILNSHPSNNHPFR